MSRLGDSLRVGGGDRGNYNDDHDHDDEDSSSASSDIESSASRPLVSDRSSLIKQVKAQIGKTSPTGGGNNTSRRLGETGVNIEDVDSALERTSRALAETELFGQMTSTQLLQQRESFQRQRAQLSATDEYLSRSKNLLQRMQYRIVTDKLVQGIIIMVELFAIGAIIYFKYYR